jgi:hypothetical protein
VLQHEVLVGKLLAVDGTTPGTWKVVIMLSHATTFLGIYIIH